MYGRYVCHDGLYEVETPDGLMPLRYQLMDYSGQVTCETTYTCDYGQGFDQVSVTPKLCPSYFFYFWFCQPLPADIYDIEVCDNQKWALDSKLRTCFTKSLARYLLKLEITYPNTVFSYDESTFR
jgi:hypothetical protein